MNIYKPSNTDIGRCIIIFEFDAEEGSISSTLTCPINLAEDIYCAVSLEVAIIRRLTKDKLNKIIEETLSDMYVSGLSDHQTPLLH